MVRSMRPGSVLVDLAVEQGGNIALSQLGEAVDVDGAIILGFSNVAGRLAADASSLYARNVLNFVSAFWNKDAKALAIDWNDDIIKSVGLTRDGQLVHPSFSAPVAPAPVLATNASPATQGTA
jgi:NAD(P) transhydrogenase subunit alpha